MLSSRGLIFGLPSGRSIRWWDLKAVLRDVSNSEEPRSSHVILDAHDDYLLSVAHAPELEQLASASADQGVKIWQAQGSTNLPPSSPLPSPLPSSLTSP